MTRKKELHKKNCRKELIETIDNVDGVWCLLVFVLPLIHVIAEPLFMAAYVNVDCIDIGLVELNFCPPARPSLVCAVAIVVVSG